MSESKRAPPGTLLRECDERMHSSKLRLLLVRERLSEVMKGELAQRSQTEQMCTLLRRHFR